MVVGQGGGTGPTRNPEFSPPTIKGARGRRGWDGGLDFFFKKIATDTAGSACIIEAEGPPSPPSSPSGFGNDRARGREGRSGELRPFPKSQTRETEGTQASPCRSHAHGNLGLGEMRTPFVSGGT